MSTTGQVYDVFMKYLDMMTEQPGLHIALTAIQPEGANKETVTTEVSDNFQVGMALAFTTSVATNIMMMSPGERKDQLVKMIVDTIQNEDASIINNWYEENKGSN